MTSKAGGSLEVLRFFLSLLWFRCGGVQMASEWAGCGVNPGHPEVVKCC